MGFPVRSGTTKLLQRHRLVRGHPSPSLGGLTPLLSPPSRPPLPASMVSASASAQPPPRELPSEVEPNKYSRDGSHWGLPPALAGQPLRRAMPGSQAPFRGLDGSDGACGSSVGGGAAAAAAAASTGTRAFGESYCSASDGFRTRSSRVKAIDVSARLRRVLATALRLDRADYLRLLLRGNGECVGRCARLLCHGHGDCLAYDPHFFGDLQRGVTWCASSRAAHAARGCSYCAAIAAAY